MADPNPPRRRWLRQTLVAIGSGFTGLFIGGQLVPAQAPGDFDFFRDAPVGVIVYYEGSLSAHENLPSGASPEWSVIAADRVLVGTASVSEDGTEGGTESVKSEAAHLGAAVESHPDHSVTQATAHADHAAHASAGGHTHDAHGTSLGSLVIGQVLTSPVTHSPDGGHVHDAHSPHSDHAGTAVDGHSAHAVTQPETHAVKMWRASFTLKKVLA